jgi:hypothetical protein
MIVSPVHGVTSVDDVMVCVHVDCLVYFYRTVRNITDIRYNGLFDLSLMASPPVSKFYQGAKVFTATRRKSLFNYQ